MLRAADAVDRAPTGVIEPVEPPVGAASAVLAAALLVGAGGFAVGAPEAVVARVLAALFVVCGLVAPPAGLVLLVFLTPFFLGEEFQAYFWLPEVLVYATLAGAAWRVARVAHRPRFPWAPVFLLFLVSTVVSVPLNLRELVWELRDGSVATLWEDVWGGHYWANAFYFRMVLDVASGIGLYVLAANLAWSRVSIQRLALTLTVVVTALLALELLIFWRVIPAGSRYLGLMLAGHSGVAAFVFSGPSLNQGYLAHALVAFLPLAVYTGRDHPRPAGRLIGGLAGLTILVSAVLTGQKAVFGVLALQVAAFGAVGLVLPGRRRTAGQRLAGAGLAIAVLLAGFVLLAPQWEWIAQQFRVLVQGGDAFRSHGLAVAARMFLDHPGLGVGTGRFIRFFAEYSSAPGMDYIWSHNLYAQLLAEQGLLGLLAFVALVVVVAAHLSRRERLPRNDWAPMAFVAISLGSWLAYGAVHYIFLVRSLQLHFWIGLGLLAAMAPEAGHTLRWRAAWVIPTAVLVTVAFVLHVGAAIRRPPTEAGLYPSEAIGDGTSFRWSRGTATLDLPVEGAALSLMLASPGIAGRAPQVTLFLDGSIVRQVTAVPGTWVRYDLPVGRPSGHRVRLQIRVSPTFVPREVGLGEDPRRLGVMLRPVAWVRTEGG